MRELGLRLEAHVSVIQGAVKSLVRKGYLGDGDRRGRGLRLLRQPDGSPFGGFGDPPPANAREIPADE